MPTTVHLHNKIMICDQEIIKFLHCDLPRGPSFCIISTRAIKLWPSNLMIYPYVIIALKARWKTFCPRLFHQDNCTLHVSIQCKIRQSSISCAGLLGRWDERLIDQASDVPSIIFVFIVSYRFNIFRALKTLHLYFCKFLKKKKNWKHFCNQFCKKL